MSHKVQKRRRRVGRNLVESKYYYLRYQTDWMPADKWKSLKSTDRQAAEKRALNFISEFEREHAGILEPRALRDAAQRPLADMVDDFANDLVAKGRAKQYISDVRTRLTRLFAETGWNRFANITPDGFIRWRSSVRGQFAAKTLNDYLTIANGFLLWCERNAWVKINPLRHVERIDARGQQKIRRRALSDDELRRLIEAAGSNKGCLFFFAARTGLRRNEVHTLTWGDSANEKLAGRA